LVVESILSRSSHFFVATVRDGWLELITRWTVAVRTEVTAAVFSAEGLSGVQPAIFIAIGTTVGHMPASPVRNILV
jgi:hypothetical protein